MKKQVGRNLTLDRPVTYEIKVPGYLNECWSDWAGEMNIVVQCDCNNRPFTTLTGTLDQAALQGLLRRLYSLGLPLISVNIDDDGQTSVKH
jgi:hypothetical protein